jgi:uncharacterized peroxidase-related enzyme
VTANGFLDTPESSDAAETLFEEDRVELGHVMNSTRLWAYQPETYTALFGLIGDCVRAGDLTFRERGILVTACASTVGDAYCSLAWGAKLASASDADTAAGVLRGADLTLSPAEQAMAQWARRVARDPNGTTPADVQALRDTGHSDARIFAITAFVALRIAFSTVNDALGARPDAELVESAPAAVVAAVDFGRITQHGRR